MRTAALIALLLCSASAFAQRASQQIADPNLNDQQFTWWVMGDGAGNFRADLDAGSFAVWRASAEVGMRYDFSESLRLVLSLRQEFSEYDFAGATTLVPGDAEPWEDVHSSRVEARLAGRFEGAWGWVVGGAGRLSFEPGADVGSSLLGLGYGGIQYRFSDDFSLTLGAGVASRLEDDARVFPLVALEWRVSEQVRVRSDGLGLAVIAQVADGWELVMRGAYESREWRLSEDRGVLADGVARDDRVVVGGEVAWKPTPRFRIAVQGGVAMWQELEALTAAGVTVGEQEGDPSPYVGLVASLTF